MPRRHIEAKLKAVTKWVYARKVLELTRSVTNHRDWSGTLSRQRLCAVGLLYSIAPRWILANVNVAHRFVLTRIKTNLVRSHVYLSPSSAVVYFSDPVLPHPRLRTMATVVAPPAFHTAGHAFAPHHSGFTALHQHQQVPLYRGSTAVPHNPFGAFAPRHHSGTKSPSAAASWRHPESAERTPIATRTTPNYRRGGPSHSRTPSTSSEASSSSWRDRSRSPAVATVELQPASVAQQAKPKGKSTCVFFGGCDLNRLVQQSLSPPQYLFTVLQICFGFRHPLLWESVLSRK